MTDAEFLDDLERRIPADDWTDEEIIKIRTMCGWVHTITDAARVWLRYPARKAIYVQDARKVRTEFVLQRLLS